MGVFVFAGDTQTAAAAILVPPPQIIVHTHHEGEVDISEASNFFAIILNLSGSTAATTTCAGSLLPPCRRR